LVFYENPHLFSFLSSVRPAFKQLMYKEPTTFFRLSPPFKRTGHEVCLSWRLLFFFLFMRYWEREALAIVVLVSSNSLCPPLFLSTYKFFSVKRTFHTDPKGPYCGSNLSRCEPPRFFFFFRMHPSPREAYRRSGGAQVFSLFSWGGKVEMPRLPFFSSPFICRIGSLAEI